MSRKNFIIASISIFAITIAVVVIAVLLFPHRVTTAKLDPGVVTATVPVPVAQPQSVAAVAKSVNCTRVKTYGTDDLMTSGYGMVDSGTCYIGKGKYALNTFTTEAGMKKWVKDSAVLGVIPKWETKTAVVYKSVGSS